MVDLLFGVYGCGSTLVVRVGFVWMFEFGCLVFVQLLCLWGGSCLCLLVGLLVDVLLIVLSSWILC